MTVMTRALGMTLTRPSPHGFWTIARPDGEVIKTGCSLEEATLRASAEHARVWTPPAHGDRAPDIYLGWTRTYPEEYEPGVGPVRWEMWLSTQHEYPGTVVYVVNADGEVISNARAEREALRRVNAHLSGKPWRR